jgi:hypothetical protein
VSIGAARHEYAPEDQHHGKVQDRHHGDDGRIDVPPDERSASATSSNAKASWTKVMSASPSGRGFVGHRIFARTSAGRIARIG